MIVTNKKTGEDITGLFIKRLEGTLTKREFEELTGLTFQKDNNEKDTND